MLAETLDDAMTLAAALHNKTLPVLIDKLRGERRKVCERRDALAGATARLGIAELLPELENLCQLLVDYVALGHFEVFQVMRECPGGGNARCRRMHALLDELDTGLGDTAQAAVEFNDRYGGEHTRTFEQLDTDLARLGAVLATRAALEERLFAAWSAA